MKALHVGLFSCLGMVLVGGAVFAVTPAGGFSATAERRTASVDDDDTPSKGRSGTGDRKQSNDPSSVFDVGSVLTLEGRMGHAALLASDPGETYVMLEVRGDDRAAAAPPNAALSIVIDKSGSMAGTRITNALQGAVRAVEQLRDGDTLSVIAFDTRAEKVVPLTTINASTRQSAIQAIRNIQLGSDTCISCGLEEGLADLKSAAAQKNGVVTRMILLSDGKTNNGIRDIPGFNGLAQRALAQGVNITTVGVDVDFDEKVMSAIAVSSNGRHYFVENDVDLTRVFEQEAQNVVHSVASNVVADLELAPGVELVRVFDRTFSRAGSRVSVPMGAFAKGEVKTVLVKVRIPKGDVGMAQVASVRLGYRDMANEKDDAVSGKLAVELVSDRGSVSKLDAIVLDRVQRSETAVALKEANDLFEAGKADEAKRRLEAQVKANESARPLAKPASSARAADIDKSFESQNAELNKAAGNFGAAATASPGGAPAPAPVQRAGKAQQKRSAEQADAFGL